jgi:hypothetical protein
MIRTLKVNSARNSLCTSAPLEALDWANWWTDGSSSRGIYLHVARLDRRGDPADERVHRVWCRRVLQSVGESARLKLRNGELCWLVGSTTEAELRKYREKRKRRSTHR